MDVVMPQLGETVAEGTIVKWHGKPGDEIKQGDILFEVETEKVTMEIPAAATGTLAEIAVPEGSTAYVGARLAVIREARESSVRELSAKSAPPVSRTFNDTEDTSLSVLRRTRSQRLSSAVRRLCDLHDVEIERIVGSGGDGRITRQDVEQYISRRGDNGSAQETRFPARPSLEEASSASEVLEKVRSDEVKAHVRMSSIRRRTAVHVKRAWSTVPHVAQAVEIDFGAVEAIRLACGEDWKSRKGFSLTYLPFIVRAICMALEKFPRLNATFVEGRLMQSEVINVGIAVDIWMDGLVVPVIKNAQIKPVQTIAEEIFDLARRARSGELRSNEVSEGTYTVSNNGTFGTYMTAPIINIPQVATLSVDAVSKRPTVIECAEVDTVAIRPMGLLVQSFDHRAVDGAYSASFLRKLKEAIETEKWSEEIG